MMIKKSPILKIVSWILVIQLLSPGLSPAFTNFEKDALAPPLATKPCAEIVRNSAGEWDVAVNADVIRTYRTRWTAVELGVIIAQALQLQISRETLIPLLEKYIRERTAIDDISFRDLDIGHIEEEREGERLVAFRLPVTKGGVPFSTVRYYLPPGGEAPERWIPLRDGTLVGVERIGRLLESDIFKHPRERRAPDGSAAKCLKTIFLDDNLRTKTDISIRKDLCPKRFKEDGTLYSPGTVYREVKVLKDFGILIPGAKPRTYQLCPEIMVLPPPAGGRPHPLVAAIMAVEIAGVRWFEHTRPVPPDLIEPLRGRVRELMEEEETRQVQAFSDKALSELVRSGGAERIEEGSVAVPLPDGSNRDFPYVIWLLSEGGFIITDRDCRPFGGIMTDEGLPYDSVDDVKTALSSWQMIREVVARRQVRMRSIIERKLAAGNLRILYVCSGNVNRSATMDIITRDFVERMGLADIITVASGGTGGLEGTMHTIDLRVTAEVRDEAVRHGMVHAAETFEQSYLSDDLREAAEADIIFTAEAMHAAAILTRAPEMREKVFLFNEFRPIEDPDTGAYLPDTSDFEEVQRVLEEYLFPLLLRVPANGANGGAVYDDPFEDRIIGLAMERGRLRHPYDDAGTLAARRPVTETFVASFDELEALRAALGRSPRHYTDAFLSVVINKAQRKPDGTYRASFATIDAILGDKGIGVRKGETTFTGDGKDYAVLTLVYDDAGAPAAYEDAREIVGSIDSAVLGRHFTGMRSKAYEEGFYVAAAAISDIGANGGEPVELHLAVVNPLGKEYMEAFRRGMRDAAAWCNASVVVFAAETLRADLGPMSVTATVIGSVAAGQLSLSNEIRPGMHVYVAGFTGVEKIERWQKNIEYLRQNLDPAMRGAVLAALEGEGTASDVSDSLLKSLRNCLRSASGPLHIVLDPEAVLETFPEELRERYAEADILDACLTGGDSYALVIVTPRSLEELGADFPVTRIGTVTESGDGRSAVVLPPEAPLAPASDDASPPAAPSRVTEEDARSQADLFADAARRTQPAAEKKPLMFALGTGFIKGYAPGGAQHNGLNPLITSLAPFFERHGIYFVADDDAGLLGRIEEKKAEKGIDDMTLIVMADRGTVTSDAFLALRALYETSLVGVDAHELGEHSFIRLLEMMTMALELAFDHALLRRHDAIGHARDETLGIDILIPHAGPFVYDDTELDLLYTAQRFA